MRIVSTIALTPTFDFQGRPARGAVFDTFAGDKRFVTVVLQSPDGGEHVSELGQKVLEVAAAYHDAQQDGAAGAMHAVQVFAESTARAQAVKVFTAVADGSLVVFFGREDHVCAALIKALGARNAGNG